MGKRRSPHARATALVLALALGFAAHAAPAAPRQAPAQDTLQTPLPPQTQQPGPQPPAQDGDEEVVRITSNLVQFDVTVTGPDGKAAADLGPEDFELFVGGARRDISSVSFVSNVEGTVTARRAAGPAARAGERRGPSAMAPDPPVRLRPEQVRRTVALVVDDLGSSFESLARLRFALKRIVDEQLQPGDLAAVVRTSAGMGALQQFTSDKQILHRAVERIRWKPFGRAGVGVYVPAASDGVPREGGAGALDDEEARQFREDIFAAGTLGALNFVVRGLRQLPGRKSVVVLSDGIDISARGPQAERLREGMRRLVDLANRSSVVVYTMDARGLSYQGPTVADENITGQIATSRGGQTNSGLDGLRTRQTDAAFGARSGLEYLARGTGGVFLRNTNDVPGSVRKFLEDQRGYYLIAFRPDEAMFDAEAGRVRFNDLDVRVTRAGYKVRTRGGFYGFAETGAKQPIPRTRSEQLIAALVSPLSSGAIPVRLTSLFSSEAAGEASITSLLHVDASALQFAEEAGGARRAVVDVAALTFGEDGRLVDERNHTETLRARDEGEYRRILREGVVYSIRMPAGKPGAYQLRAAVRDAATEKVGSASQFIEAPDLKRGRLALSGVALSALGSAETDPSGGPAVRRFARGSRVKYLFDIYNAKPGKDTGRPRPTTQVRLFRDGRQVYAGRVTRFDAATRPDASRLRAAFSLQLGVDLAPGDYVLQVIVNDPLAGEGRGVAAQWIDFEIVD